MASKLERRLPCKHKVNDWLIKKSYNITSQGGEDGVLAQIFNLFNQKEQNCPCNRWCVEFGAWDGKHLSNTWQLLYNESNIWSGILIEADKDRIDAMQKMYANHTNVTCVNSFITLDGENTLTNILQRQACNLPKDFDLLSIDIDGADYHVWAEFDILKYQPKVVVIEFNPTIPNNIIYIQPRSTNVYQGSSLAALIQLGKEKGYELVSTTTFNAIFVQKEYYAWFHISDNSIDKMHDVSMPTEFFQLYDGTIKLTGCTKLIWRDIPIHENKIQILSMEERKFPFLPSEFDHLQQAKIRYENCIASKNPTMDDIKFFIQTANEVFSKIPDTDIRVFLSYAIDLCKLADSKEDEDMMNLIQQTCERFYEVQLKESHPGNACEWLDFLLRHKPFCSSKERAALMQKIGECYVRARDFTQAEFYLQTSLAIDAKAIPTLKSLAKLYTKLENYKIRDNIVDKIKKLQMSK